MNAKPQTTAAFQTPPGKGGIAVIALAGPETARILQSVFRPMKSHGLASPQIIRLGHLVDDGRVIDEAVVHQRGDFAEINIHGGPAAARAALELLARHGAKVVPLSAAGTFARAHPSLDNAAVGAEMLELLPLARSELVVSALTNQWSGGISALARSAGGQDASALRQAARGLAIMKKLLEPPEVVIAGPPNVGKSMLANALVGREVSIVDESVGTTRDWVRELALIGGVPLWITDTAGLWDAPGPIDAEAVRRARHQAESADLVVLLAAGDKIEAPPWLHAKRVLKAAAKADVCPPAAGADVAISAATGQGLDELRGRILDMLGLEGVNPSTPMAFTDRQVSLLNRAADAMENGDASAARAVLLELLEG